MPWEFFKTWNLRRVGLSILGIALIVFAFLAGSSLQKRLENSHGSALITSKVSQPKLITLTDPILRKQAQDNLIQFLSYAKDKGLPDMKISDYKVQKLITIYMKSQEIHANFLFDAIPADPTSSQKLIRGGGTAQKDGWVINNKAYVVLEEQGSTYTLHAVSFTQPTGF